MAMTSSTQDEQSDVFDVEVNHVPFNPSWATAEHSPLGQVCNAMAEGNWQLVRVVPHHAYESIAVFERRSYR